MKREREGKRVLAREDGEMDRERATVIEETDGGRAGESERAREGERVRERRERR